MDNLSFWFCLALGQFVAFALLMPLFDKQWKDGFFKGCIAVVVTVIMGIIISGYLERHRKEQFIEDVRQQLLVDQPQEEK
jgi:uncharacterized membrane protein YraQ (UPF0718 family)